MIRTGWTLCVGVLGVLVLLASVSGVAWAQATPHDTGFNSSYSCTTCHATHLPAGPNLTRQPTNAALCQSCHKDTGDAAELAMPDSSMATPGVGGSSHRWQALANQPAYEVALPAGSLLAPHIDGSDPQNPKIICSTCHDQHTNGVYRQRQRIRAVIHTQGGGPATFGTLTAVSSTANARGFLIDFVTGGTVGTSPDPTYRLSYDSGISWLGWNGTQWGSLGTGSPAFAPRAAGPGQDLTNSAGEVVATFARAFSGPTPTAGDSDRYKFYVGYPFSRAALDNGDNVTGSMYCRACHSSRAQTFSDVRTYTGTYRSHPVGQTLNANGGGYDRAAPLDANGAVQGSGDQDSLAANDLVLDTGGLVQCTTCHAVHYAPSNSLYDPGGRR